MSDATPNPILVEVQRGSMAESYHRGAIVVVNSNGTVLHSWGNANKLVYPHSSIKSIQALSLLESGAYKAFNLGPEEIALACASHTGEAMHTELAQKWLRKIEEQEEVLACGSHAPLDKKTRQKLFASQNKPTAVHNTCSGKHLGFITTAKHLGIDPKGYAMRSHPVQKMAEKTLSELSHSKLTDQQSGIDGCGIPVVSIPLYNLALAMANFVSPNCLSEKRRVAAEMIINAKRSHPTLVGGNQKLCSRLMKHCPNLIVKDGNEGVYTAALPDKRIGIALTIDDGSLKAADVAITNLLKVLDVIPTGVENEFKNDLKPEIRNFTRTLTGHMQAIF